MEDDTQRRARYGADSRLWGNQKRPRDRKMLLVIQTLYPNVILTNKRVMIYKQAHSLSTPRIVIGFVYAKRDEDEKERVARDLKNKRF